MQCTCKSSFVKVGIPGKSHESRFKMDRGGIVHLAKIKLCRRVRARLLFIFDFQGALIFMFLLGYLYVYCSYSTETTLLKCCTYCTDTTDPMRIT